MNIIKVPNPFIIGHYESHEYFCDRENEVKTLIKHIENGRNVTLTSPRRIGKTLLINHLFTKKEITQNYYTFFVDLYATSSLAEFVALMGRVIYEDLQSEITSPQVSIDEIFDYLERADRHCIVAIDEFQQIMQYDEKNVEALLRTKIQHCRNVTFIFTGSKRHMMTQMFHTQSKPFYQSTIGMSLDVIDKNRYISFAQRLFDQYDKKIEPSTVESVYDRYHGYTWYIQMVMNELFFMTDRGNCCSSDMIETAVQNIISSQTGYYKTMLSDCATKQRSVLYAIAKEEFRTKAYAEGITTSDFIKRHSLTSASSVQAAIKGLIDKDIITYEDSRYHIDDLFFTEYINSI